MSVEIKNHPFLSLASTATYIMFYKRYISGQWSSWHSINHTAFVVHNHHNFTRQKKSIYIT